MKAWGIQVSSQEQWEATKTVFKKVFKVVFLKDHSGCRVNNGECVAGGGVEGSSHEVWEK